MSSMPLTKEYELKLLTHRDIQSGLCQANEKSLTDTTLIIHYSTCDCYDYVIEESVCLVDQMYIY